MSPSFLGTLPMACLALPVLQYISCFEFCGRRHVLHIMARPGDAKVTEQGDQDLTPGHILKLTHKGASPDPVCGLISTIACYIWPSLGAENLHVGTFYFFCFPLFSCWFRTVD